MYAALCIVAKRCKVGISRLQKSNRNVGMTFLLVPFSGVELGGGHNLTFEFRPDHGRSLSVVLGGIGKMWVEFRLVKIPTP